MILLMAAIIGGIPGASGASAFATGPIGEMRFPVSDRIPSGAPISRDGTAGLSVGSAKHTQSSSIYPGAAKGRC
jgi:hypothetical protein